MAWAVVVPPRSLVVGAAPVQVCGILMLPRLYRETTRLAGSSVPPPTPQPLPLPQLLPLA